MIHTVKGFGIVNKAEIDVFMELSCFFHDPEDVGSLISGSSSFSKTSLKKYGMESRCRVARVGDDGKQIACRTFVTELLCPWTWWRRKPAHVTELQRRKWVHTGTNETGLQIPGWDITTLIP